MPSPPTPPVFTITPARTPLICAAIHSGHYIRPSLLPYLAIGEADRLREEDPYTAEWAEIGEARIIGCRSRFEVDLNRPPEKAVYRTPEDAWGLEVWRGELPREEYEQSMREYRDFYQEVRRLLDRAAAEFGSFVVYDIHSYNHRREGPAGKEAPPADNPEVNVGTGTLDRARWAPVVDGFIGAMRGWDFFGHSLDVRENVKFRGGYFPQWIHENYPDSGCVLAIEFKKIFMDEWTGEPEREVFANLKGALESTVPIVLRQWERVS